MFPVSLTRPLVMSGEHALLASGRVTIICIYEFKHINFKLFLNEYGIRFVFKTEHTSYSIRY